MCGAEALRIGRAHDQQAEGAAVAAQRQDHGRVHAGGVVQPAHRFEIVVAAAVGRQQAAGEQARVFRHALRHTSAPSCSGARPHRRRVACGTPKWSRRPSTTRVGRSAPSRARQQALGPGVELVGDGGIVLRQVDQLGHAQFERLVLVAHDFHLAFLQRHGLAGQRARQANLAQQAGVFFEEAADCRPGRRRRRRNPVVRSLRSVAVAVKYAQF